MDTQAKLIAAQRLIKIVTGEPYGDGMTVTDVGVGYAEHGYHDDETVWVLGDWNDKQRYVDGEWITTSTLPSRLFDALERIGVEGEWSDEWYRCSDCYRIMRHEPDSYMWQPGYVIINECEPVCTDCAITMGEDALTDYVNDSNRVVTWCDESHLESLGWQRHNPSEYQSGWHEGMDDKPDTIMAKIQEADPTLDVVFWLDESSQFYIGFSAFTRKQEQEEDE